MKKLVKGDKVVISDSSDIYIYEGVPKNQPPNYHQAVLTCVTTGELKLARSTAVKAVPLTSEQEINNMLAALSSMSSDWSDYDCCVKLYELGYRLIEEDTQ